MLSLVCSTLIQIDASRFVLIAFGYLSVVCAMVSISSSISYELFLQCDATNINRKCAMIGGFEKVKDDVYEVTGLENQKLWMRWCLLYRRL